ncbi:MAG: hypothetical protein KGI38_10930 [Thaumarchaeota archaeon]|nr:hypothetical protein [Nitrososphaerota archaeon]
MNQRAQTARLEEAQDSSANRSKVVSFQALLNNALTTALTEVLGAAGARATFFHLGLTESAGAGKIHDGLVRIFGRGTQSLEASILRELYTRLGTTFEPEESATFATYVNQAQKFHNKEKGV